MSMSRYCHEAELPYLVQPYMMMTHCQYDILIVGWCIWDDCIFVEASAIAFASETLSPNVHVKVLSCIRAPISHPTIQDDDESSKCYIDPRMVYLG